MRFLCIILSDALAEGGMWVGRDADTGRLHDRKNFELRNGYTNSNNLYYLLGRRVGHPHCFSYQ